MEMKTIFETEGVIASLIKCKYERINNEIRVCLYIILISQYSINKFMVKKRDIYEDKLLHERRLILSKKKRKKRLIIQGKYRNLQSSGT